MADDAVFWHDKHLQCPVKVETPSPVYVRMLQQATGGVEGETRVSMQCMFQSWGSRGPTPRCRDMLMHTATEEAGHIKMLATAVAPNLEKAPASLQEQGASDGVVGAIMGGGNGRHAIGGMLHRHVLSAGMSSYPASADGVPFDTSHISAGGNPAATMDCNVAAEATGRVLAVRPHNATGDAGMTDMLAFTIGRDTMRRQQWLAVIEEPGGPQGALPIPNSFPRPKEDQEHNRQFVATAKDGTPPMPGRWAHGPSLDGKGEYPVFQNVPRGEVPDSGAETQQIS